jgi:ABC-type protease/lipase transport system fused ATPase/permease subunit
VRRRQGIVVMITHSSQSMESANVVALMCEGRFVEFGPKDEVARKLAPKAPAPGRLAPVRAATAPQPHPDDTVVEFNRPERHVS